MSPIALQLGPISIHWYGIMYAISFIAAYFLLHKTSIGSNLNLPPEKKDSLLITIILSVLIGGRLGYILFYNLPFYIENPLKSFAVWEGGMSFHGGLLAVIISLIYFSKKNKLPFLKLTDTAVLIAPLGIFLGRIGNFINSELYGRITNSPLCLNFKTDPENCRYPSQLFEAFFEGLLLFAVLNIFFKNSKPGIISSYFLILYGFFRFQIEFLREPDTQIGLYLNSISQGQLLSLLMILSGLLLLNRLKNKNL